MNNVWTDEGEPKLTQKIAPQENVNYIYKNCITENLSTFY